MTTLRWCGLAAIVIVALVIVQIPSVAFAETGPSAAQCACVDGGCSSQVPGREMSRREVARYLGKVLALENTREIRNLLPAGASFRPSEARGLDIGEGLTIVFIPVKLGDGSLAGFTSAALENGKVVADYGAVVRNGVVQFLAGGKVVKEVTPEATTPDTEVSAQQANWGCAIPCALGCELSYYLVNPILGFACGAIFCTWVCS